MYRCLPHCVLALGLAVALSAGAATHDELLQQADAAASRGDSAAAVDLFSQALALEPRDPATLVNRGIAFSALGQHVAAALDHTRAHAIFLLTNGSARNRAITLTNRADSVLHSGDPYGALADAFAAKLVDPTYSRSLVAIAEAWYELGSFANAQAFLGEARAVDSNINRNFTAAEALRRGQGKTQPDDKADATPDFTAAAAAYSAGEYAKSLPLWDRVLALQPGNDGAWGNRGNTLLALGRNEESVLSQSHAAAFASANKSPENTARHLANRVGAWLALDDADMATVDGELATRLKPDLSYAWIRLATAYFATGDAAKAEAAQAKARELDPTLKAVEFKPETARTNALRQRVRAGDRAALVELVTAAADAKIALFEGNPARTAAIKALDGLLARAPTDAGLLVLRARAENAPEGSARFGVAEGAFAFLDRALAAAPDHTDALILRACYRLDALATTDEQKVAAYADLDRAIALGAKDPAAFTHRAEHRSELKDFAGAVADYTAALSLHRNDAELLGRRARIYEELKDWDAAFADYTRLIDQHTKGAYANRAELLLKAERLGDALDDFNHAVALEPQNPDHFLGRARAYRLQGRLDEARADHAKARELDADLPALAADLANAEAVEALRHDFKHALKRTAAAFKQVTEAAAAVGKAQREKDRAEQRLQRMFTGEKRPPDKVLEEVTDDEKLGTADAQDYREQACAYVKLDRYDDALAALDRSIALSDKDATAIDLRGRIHESRKEMDLAFADYDRAVTLEPNDADYRRDRGDIWWDRSDYAKALADYEVAVVNAEKDPSNWFKRGNARLALGRFDDAIADYDKAIELKPDLEAAKRNRALAVKRKAGQ